MPAFEQLTHLQQALLIALYDLADGNADAPVSGEAARQYVNEHGLLAMSVSELQEYRLKVRARVMGSRN